MAQCDSTAERVLLHNDCKHLSKSLPVDVDLRGINAENLLNNPDDNREGFVDLEKGDIVELETSLLDGDGEGNSGGRGEIDGFDTSIGVCYLILVS